MLDAINIFKCCRRTDAVEAASSSVANKLVTARQAQEPIMLFGFNAKRIAYFSDQSKVPARPPLFSIDRLNDAMSLPDRIELDLGGLSTALREHTPPPTDAMRATLANAPRTLAQLTGMEEKQAAGYLKSWQAFLAKNADRLSISSLLRFDRLRGADVGEITKHLFSVINKNLDDNVVSDETVDELKDAIWALSSIPEGYVSAALREMMEQLDDLPNIMTNAVFRETSKMALEWAKKENIPIHFVGGKSLRGQLMKAAALPEYQRAPYKTDHRVRNSFSPITHSEMRKDIRMENYVTDVRTPKGAA